MLIKRLEQGQFVWPSATSTGRIALSAPQLAALLDGCEWRAPVPVRRPELGGLKIRNLRRKHLFLPRLGTATSGGEGPERKNSTVERIGGQTLMHQHRQSRHALRMSVTRKPGRPEGWTRARPMAR